MGRRADTTTNTLRFQRSGALTGILVGIFWIWGILGFVVIILEVTTMGRGGSIGVGTSSYVTSIAASWIGGLVFFGLGSILSGQSSSIGPVPVFIAKAPAMARGFDGEFSGFPFRIRQDKVVEAEIENEIYEFSDWKAFVDYARQ